ncbi:MAG: glycosyltransferase family A protein [Gammaproteobacteria bacterium]
MHISVIIPSYNRAHTLPRALDSVLAQSRAADEILVIDDGSTDATRRLVTESYPQVRYIYQDNAGVSAARNTGIRQARGEWLALLDSDDEWLPDKLARQAAAIAAEPDYQLCHCDEIWIRQGRRVNPMKKHAKAGGWIFERCLPLCAISPSAVLLHRALLDQVGLFDERLPACEDYDLWLRVCARHPVLYVEDALLKKYGGHEDQLSQQHWGMDRFRIQALDNALQTLPLKPGDRQAAMATLASKLRIFINGARKRQQHEGLEYYQSLLSRYEVCHD